jgi:hypothetical protein
MRNILIFLVLLLAACDVSENKITRPENSKTQMINLEGGLGVVSLSLPVRYDTTFTWIHYSDCGAPCEKRKHGFSQSHYRLIWKTATSTKL